MELSGHRMLSKQDEAHNGLHLRTFERQTNAVSSGLIIREYTCPFCFYCKCRVGVHTVEGTGFIQLESRGPHHSNSHVRHLMVARNIEADDDVPPELGEGSDNEDDLDSVYDEDDDDEDDDPGDRNDAISADDGM